MFKMVVGYFRRNSVRTVLAHSGLQGNLHHVAPRGDRGLRGQAVEQVHPDGISATCVLWQACCNTHSNCSVPVPAGPRLTQNAPPYGGPGA